MKTNKKIYSIALASVTLVLFLILISSMALAIPVDNATLTINETQISTSGFATSPDIYGDKIVWQDNRSGKWNIYMYDFFTSKETQITTSGSATSPSIDGNRIVWIDGRNGENLNYSDENAGGHDIYMYDFSTKKETRITKTTIPADGFGYTLTAAISGNKIIWGGTYYYRIYDLSTHRETGTNHLSIVWPVFKGNRIVGVNDIDGRPSNIYMYDLSASKQTQITTSDNAFDPEIYNNIIVWTSQRDANDGTYIYDTNMYDLFTKKETQLSTSISASNPNIYGNRIIWEDYHTESDGNYTHNIYMYDLSTKKQTHTANTSASIQAMYGDKIVWVDYRTDNNSDDFPESDIYMGTLSENGSIPVPPVANFSAAPISGKEPLTVKFTSTSTGAPTAWKWNFGDGSPLSTGKNPEHVYSKAGTYTIKHTAINSYGRDTEIKIKYITVTAPLKAPVAAFSASSVSGKAPLKVQFTDKSKGSPTSWNWSFGDGTFSTVKSPTHKYTKPGKYTVGLTVKNTADNDTVKKIGYIIVKK